MSTGLGRDEQATTRLSAFGSLDPTELDDLRHVAGQERELDCTETLWHEGDRLPGLFLLLDGWMASATGERERLRLSKVHLPGDVLGLPSLAFQAASETVVALTRAKLRSIPLHSFGHLFEAQPRIAAMLFLVSQQERMDLTDRLDAAVHSSAEERVAAFFLHLYRRVERSSPGTGDAFHLPLDKDQLADVIGLSIGHMDKALKRLRDGEVLGWSRQRVTILDMTKLIDAARLPSRQLAQDLYWLPSSE